MRISKSRSPWFCASEISFGREGRARTRTIHIATTPTPENAWARPSASSAPSASARKSNPANGFLAPSLRTVANDADGRTDGSGRGATPTVRANPLKTNAVTVADGRTQIPRSNPLRKKPARRAGGRGYERG
jgi:hypothetical protein